MASAGQGLPYKSCAAPDMTFLTINKRTRLKHKTRSRIVDEEFPILPAIVGVLLVGWLGFELSRQRTRLREVFNVFDKQESLIAGALEGMVASGELKPYKPV